jgi:ADP-ribose pyrophosphatase YjhB (NUDIX family)
MGRVLPAPLPTLAHHGVWFRGAMTEQGATIAVAARALVTRSGGDRLLVSDDGCRWYTPGGRLAPGESLKECVAREVYEETGLKVEVGNLVYVSEFWEHEFNQHKVECFFLATLEAGQLTGGWKDLDGLVEHMRFFSEEEWSVSVHPEFLRQLDVEDLLDRKDVYKGFERGPGQPLT